MKTGAGVLTLYASPTSICLKIGNKIRTDALSSGFVTLQTAFNTEFCNGI
jgi:hypothetical protein